MYNEDDVFDNVAPFPRGKFLYDDSDIVMDMNVFDSHQSDYMSAQEQAAFVAGNIHRDGCSDVWVNLTNGIEAVEFLDKYNVPFNYCRFQSTSFEQKNWSASVDSMPDDMLINMALGRRQVIIDFGANKMCPRAMRQGIPIAAYIIAQYWNIDNGGELHMFSRDGNKIIKAGDNFSREVSRLSNRQKSRLKYFGKFIDDDVNWIDISLLCAQSDNDNDYETHIDSLHRSSRAMRYEDYLD